jgi:hypothetical protein
MAVKHKTDELEGALLDAVVAKLVGQPAHIIGGRCIGDRGTAENYGFCYSPSSDWAQGGPLIEREGIQLSYDSATSIEGMNPLPWFACIGDDLAYMRDAGWGAKGEGYGSTPLVAAMRAFVQMRLGAEVDL